MFKLVFKKLFPYPYVNYILFVMGVFIICWSISYSFLDGWIGQLGFCLGFVLTYTSVFTASRRKQNYHYNETKPKETIMQQRAMKITEENLYTVSLLTDGKPITSAEIVSDVYLVIIEEELSKIQWIMMGANRFFSQYEFVPNEVPNVLIPIREI